MPIRDIQRRHAELGRIRLGDKGSKGQPQKLTQFRFTSPQERHIRDLAELYGGAAQAWKNGNRDEWEVYTTATSIPVIVVRGGVSQWMETWSGGGCTHRCDGYHNVLTDTDCDPDDPAHKAAKPTTRLSVMLRDLDAIGVWRLESHGWNAASELPGLVELAQQVADLVPARLVLTERIAIKDGRTSRFVVPGLDLEVSPSRLAAIVSGQAALAIEAQPQRQAIEQQGAARDWLADGLAATTVDGVRDVWLAARDAGALTEPMAEQFTLRVQELEPPSQQPAQESAQASDEPPGWVTDAPAPDAAALWNEAVALAGQRGWSLSGLEGEFEGYHAVPVADATPEQLASFVHALRTGEVGSVAS